MGTATLTTAGSSSSLIGRLTSLPRGDDRATFVLESSRRLLAQERQVLFHRRSAICFYPAVTGINGSVAPALEGWLVGFAAVHMDGADMQAFIGFVCFFGVALPLICLVSALLHYNKYERCRQHLHQMRLEFQRDQLDREISARRSGRTSGVAGRQAIGGVSTAYIPHESRGSALH